MMITVFCLAAFAQANAQQTTIRGKVSDNKGAAISGVNVKIKGSLSGTTTDQSGLYSISVPAGSTLVFDFLGFLPQEISTSGKTSIDVILAEDTQNLDEVVVTALGIQRNAKSLAYSVTQVGGENFSKARENNLGSALVGRIAGVTVTSGSTGPTGGSRVVIRGNGSLNGDNQPLLVVNDVPAANGALSSINPDDIESLSVLKGGTAAALYGSAAANGVILVTTKSGKAQQGIGIEFNSTNTVSTYTQNTDWQYEYGSGLGGKKPTTTGEAIAAGRTSWGAKLDGSPVIQLDGVLRPYSAQKDNFKNFYNTGFNSANTVALSGGNETATLRFSASNMDDKGLVPNVSLNRKTFTLNGKATLAKKVELNTNLSYSLERDQNRTATNDFVSNPNGAVDLIATSLDVRTLAPGYDANGNQTEWNDYNFVMNPWYAVNKLYNGQTTNRLLANMSVKYNIIPSLYVSAQLGVDRVDNTTKNITPSGGLTNSFGNVSESNSFNYRRNGEVRIGYHKTFLDALDVNLLVGGNQRYNPSSGFSGSSGNLNVPGQYFLANGASQTYTRSFSESAVNSVYGSADLNYKNVYLTLTGRQDWFSTLSPESNSIFYPSVGLSYVATDGWKSKPTWLDYAKVRAAWAQVGGSTPNPYGLDLSYTALATQTMGQPLMQINGGTIPQPIRPLTSTTNELGMEVRLFNSFLADITVYDRSTTNDIVSANVARSSGYSALQVNVGKMRNRGIEVLLTQTVAKGSNNFKWDVSLNGAYNANKVISLAPGLTSISQGNTRTGNGSVASYVGLPYSMVTGFPFKTNAAGQVIYNHNTGIPIQGAAVPLGKGVAPWTAGINNDFRWKSFSGSILVDGKFGSVIYSATNDYAGFFGLDKRTTENGVRENGITVNGVADDTGLPFTKTIAAQTYWQGVAFFMTTPFVYDNSFVKLRSIVLGYDIPKSIISKVKMQGATLNFVARNLFILYKKIPNIDPESALGNSNGQGTESIGTPNSRSFGLNLSVRF